MSSESAVLPRVLFVDYEQANLDTVQRVFRKQLAMRVATSGAEALALLEREGFDVAFVDHSMPGMTGVELLRHIRERVPAIGRVMLTAYGDLPEVQQSQQTGDTQGIIMKPWSKEEILRWAERCAAQAKLKADLRLMRSSVSEMRSKTGGSQGT